VEYSTPVFSIFEVLEFYIFVTMGYLAFCIFLYKTSSMKNEEFAGDATWWGNLILVRQTEEELLLFDDNFFSLAIIIYLFG